MLAVVWGIDPDVVNHVPSNDGVNLIRYSLNPEKKLVKNYVVVGYLLKVVALGYIQSLFDNPAKPPNHQTTKP